MACSSGWATLVVIHARFGRSTISDDTTDRDRAAAAVIDVSPAARSRAPQGNLVRSQATSGSSLCCRRGLTARPDGAGRSRELPTRRAVLDAARDFVDDGLSARVQDLVQDHP